MKSSDDLINVCMVLGGDSLHEPALRRAEVESRTGHTHAYLDARSLLSDRASVDGAPLAF